MQLAISKRVERFHVTVLSNLIRGYDKYSKSYSKECIPQSTYPNQFFLLAEDDLDIGVKKASSLLDKLAIPGDRLIVIRSVLDSDRLEPNLRNGLGEYIRGHRIPVDEVFFLGDTQELQPVILEEACALSLRVLYGVERDYGDLRPRTVSVLPIAMGCQAACKFCFSKASASTDLQGKSLDERRIEQVLAEGRQRGAERAVITGGGEPGMLSSQKLESLVSCCAKYFEKVVLISNGYCWARLDEEARLDALLRLQTAGLTVLSLSRHHHESETNAAIMSLDTGSDHVARTWSKNRALFSSLSLRWICVLQKGGVCDEESVTSYLDWASSTGVDEVCFKELYVSTSEESEYHDYPANHWSRENQVSLKVVTGAAAREGWEQEFCLPWGAPVYRQNRVDRTMRIAAYTEPSLYWELSHKQCRSWNLMADGRCLASLEDSHSEVLAR